MMKNNHATVENDYLSAYIAEAQSIEQIVTIILSFTADKNCSWWHT